MRPPIILLFIALLLALSACGQLSYSPPGCGQEGRGRCVAGEGPDFDEVDPPNVPDLPEEEEEEEWDADLLELLWDIRKDVGDDVLKSHCDRVYETGTPDWR